MACAYWNLSVPELVQETILRKQGVLIDTGYLVCDIGEFTGLENVIFLMALILLIMKIFLKIQGLPIQSNILITENS